MAKISNVKKVIDIQGSQVRIEHQLESLRQRRKKNNGFV